MSWSGTKGILGLIVLSCVGCAASQSVHSPQSEQVLPNTFRAKVVSVHDGDTLTVVTHDGNRQKVRLVGIDCPEAQQSFGPQATEETGRLALNQDVTITTRGHDRYQRTLGEVQLRDGRILNQELVASGMCWWYRKYAFSDRIMEHLEFEAKAQHRGLWANPDPVPPWDWRKR